MKKKLLVLLCAGVLLTSACGGETVKADVPSSVTASSEVESTVESVEESSEEVTVEEEKPWGAPYQISLTTDDLQSITYTLYFPSITATSIGKFAYQNDAALVLFNAYVRSDETQKDITTMEAFADYQIDKLAKKMESYRGWDPDIEYTFEKTFGEERQVGNYSTYYFKGVCKGGANGDCELAGYVVDLGIGEKAWVFEVVVDDTAYRPEEAALKPGDVDMYAEQIAKHIEIQ